MTSTPPSPLSSAAPATSFGEVGPDGTVFLRLPDGSQREVGQWAAGDAQAGLEFFARKYADLVTEIDVAAKRLADDRSTPAQAAAIVERVRKSVLEPSFVGDMVALVARIGQLEVLINVKKESLAEAKEANKKSALEAREKLVAEAENSRTRSRGRSRPNGSPRSSRSGKQSRVTTARRRTNCGSRFRLLGPHSIRPDALTTPNSMPLARRRKTRKRSW